MGHVRAPGAETGALLSVAFNAGAWGLKEKWN
jgi:hypothetical protein